MTIDALGFDPSTKGASWALLRVSASKREFVACGMCESEDELVAKLRATDTSVIVGVETPMGGLGTQARSAETILPHEPVALRSCRRRV